LPRDIVARAIYREVKEGRGSPHGGVFLDIATRRSAEDIKKKLPAMYHQFKELGDVDITKERRVGRRRTTRWGEQSGLRDPDVAGEGALRGGGVRGGMHGSNRLGGNSLSTCSCSGGSPGSTREVREGDRSERGGRGADRGSVARGARPVQSDESGESGANKGDWTNPFAIHEDLMNQMQRYVGIMRNEGDLTEGLKQLERLTERRRGSASAARATTNAGWHESIDLRNMLIVSEAMAAAARLRKESAAGTRAKTSRRWIKNTGPK